MSESFPHRPASDSDSASSSSGDEAEWRAVAGDNDDEEEPLSIVSLVDDRIFSDPTAALAHCKAKTGLDMLDVRDRLGLDFHGMVKLINFVRQHVRDGKPLPAEVEAKDLEDEGLLKPVLEDDALIVCLDDLPPSAGGGDSVGGGGSSEEVEALLRRNAELQTELEQLSRQFANYRVAVQKTLDQRWQADEEPEAAAKAEGEKKDESEYYFESYAHNDIHEIMIKDAVRTDAYRDFIYANKDLFAGKTVLDIGCGTGILSLFCARAGAARVIAVDRSDILDRARENVFAAGLDGVVTCVKGRIEEVVLPVRQVDVIVSEWMGYCLLYEAMLPSVLFARDRYLAPGGLLVPSHASLWAAPVSDPDYVADHVTFWRDVYGFDFSSAMQRGIYTDSRVTTLPPASLCGDPSMFRFLDLHTVTAEELVFTAPWQSTLAKPDGDGALDGFLMWFDMFFARTRDEPSITPTTTAQEWVAAGRTKDDRVAFTTGPRGTETHWKQILFLIDTKKKTRQLAKENEGKKVGGEISYVTAEGHSRGLNIKVSWAVEGEEEQSQTWLLH